MDFLQELVGCNFFGQDKGIKPPHNLFLAYGIRQSLKGLDPLHQRRHIRFNSICLVVIEGIGEIVVQVLAVKFVQILDSRFRVLCPKDKRSCLFKGNISGLTIEPIDPLDVALG